jgi:hypothetical protein
MLGEEKKKRDNKGGQRMLGHWWSRRASLMVRMGLNEKAVSQSPSQGPKAVKEKPRRCLWEGCAGKGIGHCRGPEAEVCKCGRMSEEVIARPGGQKLER